MLNSQHGSETPKKKLILRFGGQEKILNLDERRASTLTKPKTRLLSKLKI